MNEFVRNLELTVPIIQAPMAGTSTPALAAAVSNTGGLGSIAIGNLDPARACEQIAAVRKLTDRPFNVNVFCHCPAVSNREVELAWIERLRPIFARYGATPPEELREIYRSFVVDEVMLRLLVAERPAVVSFHFGLPCQEWILALLQQGIILVATATSLTEAREAERAGINAVVAQGYEAGGHRGTFDSTLSDECLGTLELTQLLAGSLSIPIIAAGGIMDGAGIAEALSRGASAAQLGTAFLLCPESAADESYRALLRSGAARSTAMTAAISGRPARCIANLFTALGESVDPKTIPSYPIAYDAGKALAAAASSAGEGGYGAQWAGTGAALIRELPAEEIVKLLSSELSAAIAESK